MHARKNAHLKVLKVMSFHVETEFL